MIKAEPTAESNLNWSCSDPHQAAFLQLRGIEVVCELTEDGDRVRFVYERSERVAKIGDGTGEPLPEASNLEKTATGNGEPDTAGSGQEHPAGSETVIPVEIQNDGSVKAIGAEELQVLEFSEPKSDAGPGEQLQAIAKAIADGTQMIRACTGVAIPTETEAQAIAAPAETINTQ